MGRSAFMTNTQVNQTCQINATALQLFRVNKTHYYLSKCLAAKKVGEMETEN